MKVSSKPPSNSHSGTSTGDHSANGDKVGSSNGHTSENGTKNSSDSKISSGNGSLKSGNGSGSGSGNGSGNGSGEYENGCPVNGERTSPESISTTSATTDEQKDSSKSTSDPPDQRYSGKVKWFNAHIGWGWITRDIQDQDPPNQQNDIFVHVDDIEAKCETYQGERMIGLRDGESVEFCIAPGRKVGQLKAVKVTGLAGTNVIGQAINGSRGEKRAFDSDKADELL